MTEQKNEIRLTGIPASPGIVLGPIRVLASETAEVWKKYVSQENIPLEIEKFNQALSEATNDLGQLFEKTASAYGVEAAQIFQVHQAILADPMIIDECMSRIKGEAASAEYAFSMVMDKYVKILTGMSDDLFRSRTADIRDLKRRVIRHIEGANSCPLITLDKPSILFAKELTPSDTMRLERSEVLGFAMDFGARTSHATILARSIKVPAVVGLNHAAEMVHDGDMAVLDGDEGILIINPSSESVALYQKRYKAFQKNVRRLESITNLPTRTLDGKDLELASNIEFASEVDVIQRLGSDGVGLFRTEYLYLSGAADPSEEQQFEEYKSILLKLNGKPLIVRTFDLGGDKPPQFLNLPVEHNPFLGVRGVRLYFNGANKLFRTQVRAILRASVFGEMRVMLPMITCVAEVITCRKIIEEIKDDLRREGQPFAENLPIGAMIEVPSAAITADIIAQECEFLSIGTNDLIQYTVAVDRGNKNLNYLYQPYHPAVLRLIECTIEKGHQQGVWVGMCGEMASDPLMTMALIGMGLDEFSVSPVSHLHIKEIIRGVDVSACEQIARKALSFSTVEAVHHCLKESYDDKFPHEIYS